MKVAVFCAAINVPERPGPAIVPQSVETDFFSVGFIDEGWIELKVPFPEWMPSRLRARAVKMVPEYFIPLGPYDWYIWMDATFCVKAEYFAEGLVESTGVGLMSFFQHTHRNNVGEEVQKCVEWGVGGGERCREQYLAYCSEGFADHSGLYATGIFVRRPEGFGRLLMSRWFAQCLQWSQRDQVSLPYVFWKEGYQPVTLPGNILNHEHASYHRPKRGSKVL